MNPMSNKLYGGYTAEELLACLDPSTLGGPAIARDMAVKALPDLLREILGKPDESEKLRYFIVSYRSQQGNIATHGFKTLHSPQFPSVEELQDGDDTCIILNIIELNNEKDYRSLLRGTNAEI